MEDLTMEEKCENLMNVVVESRKRFGKMCIEYEQKTSLIENKMLNFQLETISNYKYKPKHVVPEVDLQTMRKDSEEFTKEILERQKRMDNLLENIQNTQAVVLQLKKDIVGRKLKARLSAQSLLAQAKANIEDENNKNVIN